MKTPIDATLIGDSVLRDWLRCDVASLGAIFVKNLPTMWRTIKGMFKTQSPIKTFIPGGLIANIVSNP